MSGEKLTVTPVRSDQNKAEIRDKKRKSRAADDDAATAAATSSTSNQSLLQSDGVVWKSTAAKNYIQESRAADDDAAATAAALLSASKKSLLQSDGVVWISAAAKNYIQENRAADDDAASAAAISSASNLSILQSDGVVWISAVAKNYIQESRAAADDNAANDAEDKARENARIRKRKSRENLSPDAKDSIRNGDSSSRAKARENLSPDAKDSIRNGDSSSRAKARENLSPDAKDSIREGNSSSRQKRRKQNSLPILTAAAPSYMPTDEFLSTFEKNPIASQALFWARTYNWKFAEWRDKDLSTLSPLDEINLRNAIKEEIDVDDDDIKRCMSNYFSIMNPTIPPRGCACCGIMDIPMARCEDEEIADLKDHQKEADSIDLDIIEFHEVNLNSNIGFIESLKLTKEALAEHLKLPDHIADTASNRDLWNRYRKVHSIMNLQYNYYYLYEELVNDVGMANFCSNCYKSLSKSTIPDNCIAKGWDLGNPARASLPELSFFEELCVSKFRVLSSAFNVKFVKQGRSGEYNTFKGHTIAFEDESPLQCANQMPDLQFIQKSIVITVEGPGKTLHSCNLERCIKNLGAMRVDSDKVIDWLTALRFLHPQYQNIEIAADINAIMENSRNNLVSNAIKLPWTKNDATTADMNTSDISKLPTNDEKDIQAWEDVDYLTEGLPLLPSEELQPSKSSYLFKSEYENQSTSSNAQILKTVKMTVGENPVNPNQVPIEIDAATMNDLHSVDETLLVGGVIQLPADENLPIDNADIPMEGNIIPNISVTEMDYAHVPIISPAIMVEANGLPQNSLLENNSTINVPSINLKRTSTNPTNIYSDFSVLLYGAFPTVFPLGCGCGTSPGPLNVNARKHLMRHYSRRPARRQKLILFLHNCKYRSENARVSRASVKTNSLPFQKFYEKVMSVGFDRDLESAISNPESKLAKDLVKELSPLILMTGAKIKFSPLERGTRAPVEMIALCRYFGLPNEYWTIGFDELRHTLVARVACFKSPGKKGEMSEMKTKSAYGFWNQSAELDLGFDEFASSIPNLTTTNLSDTDEGVEIWRQDVAEEITSDPAACTLMMDRLVKALHQCLIGLSYNGRKTKTDFSSRQRGLLGRARAYCEVTELQARKMLHWHGFYWTGLPLWLVQRAPNTRNDTTTEFNDLGHHVADLLQKTHDAMAPPRLHAIRLLAKVNKSSENLKKNRPSYFAPPSPSLSIKRLENTGFATMCAHCHGHCSTCHLTVRGVCECRLSYPRSFCVCNFPRQLVVNSNLKKELNRTFPVVQNPIKVPFWILNDTIDFHTRLQRVGVPGEDLRLLEFPQNRPAIWMNLEKIENPLPILLELLQRMYDRLSIAAGKIKFPFQNVVSFEDVKITEDIISDMMKGLGMGELRPADGEIIDDDIIDCILKLVNIPDFLDYLSMQNALIGESNRFISAAVGSTFNLQTLTSTESALCAIFYLIDYVTKELMKPQELLPFVLNAKKRFNDYPGCAPENEDPQENFRPLSRLVQIVQNGLAGTAEIGIQQCILNICNLPSHSSSEKFTFIFAKPAIREFRHAYSASKGDINTNIYIEENLDKPFDWGRDIEDPDNSTNKSADNMPTLVTSNDTTFTKCTSYQSGKKGDSERENLAYPVGEISRKNDGSIAITSQDVQYLHRGDNLAFMSITEYGCCVQRADKVIKFDSTKDNSNVHGDNKEYGRRPNGIYEFDSQYSFSDKFFQRLNSLLMVPIHGGISMIPPYPFDLNKKETPSDTSKNESDFSESIEALDVHMCADKSKYYTAQSSTGREQDNEIDFFEDWADDDIDGNDDRRNGIKTDNRNDASFIKKEQNLFAEWVLALYIPWPKKGFFYSDTSDLPFNRLEKIFLKLEEGKFLQNDDLSYTGPPGFNIRIEPYSYDAHAFAFSQKCLARHIGHLARGLRGPSIDNKVVNAAWRGRFAHQWNSPDPEQKIFPEHHARNNMKNFDDLNADGEMKSDTIVTPEQLQAFLDASTSNEDRRNNVDAKLDLYCERVINHINVIRDNSTSSNSNSTLPARFPPLEDMIYIDSDSIAKKKAKLKDEALIPTSSIVNDNVENSEFHNLSSSNRRFIASETLNRLCDPSSNAHVPNDEQRIVLKIFADYFDSKQSGEQVPPPLIWCEGPGGTGKSFIISCLEKIAFAMNLPISVSGFTGACCTSIPTETSPRTVNKTFHIPKVFSKIDKKTIGNDLRPKIIDNLQGESKEPPGFIFLDEVSFSAVSMLEIIDQRLRQLYNPNVVFGGIPIILGGDLFQLPPPKQKSIYNIGMDPETFDSRFQSSLNVRGFQLFCLFKKQSLSKQQRCTDDEHNYFNYNLRLGKTTGLKAYVKRHILKNTDIQEFNVLTAQIISPGNHERSVIIPILVQDFAKKTGSKVISWALNAFYNGNDFLRDTVMKNSESNGNILQNIYDRNPTLVCSFCSGAPVIYSHNLCPEKGIANGSRGHLYALGWPNNELHNEAIAYIAAQSGNVFLPNHLTPSFVYAVPVLRDSVRDFWRRENLSLLPDENIFSVDFLDEIETINMNGTKINVKISTPQYEYSFMSTVHKAQGATMDRIILNFLHRPCAPSVQEFHSIVVGLSRTRLGDHFRVMGNDDDFDFLDDIMPPLNLIAFMAGYDEHGMWDRKRAFEYKANKLANVPPNAKKNANGRGKMNTTQFGASTRWNQNSSTSSIPTAPIVPSPRRHAVPFINQNNLCYIITLMHVLYQVIGERVMLLCDQESQDQFIQCFNSVFQQMKCYILQTNTSISVIRIPPALMNLLHHNSQQQDSFLKLTEIFPTQLIDSFSYSIQEFRVFPVQQRFYNPNNELVQDFNFFTDHEQAVFHTTSFLEPAPPAINFGLMLPIKNECLHRVVPLSIQEILDDYFIPEIRQMNWKTENTIHGYTDVSFSHQFVNFPNFLLLQLRYGFSDNGSKQKPMSGYYVPLVIRHRNVSYNLISYTVHQGQNMSSGHYYSFNRSFISRNSWVRCSDDNIQVLPESHIPPHCCNSIFHSFTQNKDATPYILIYEKSSDEFVPIAEDEIVNVNLPLLGNNIAVVIADNNIAPTTHNNEKASDSVITSNDDVDVNVNTSIIPILNDTIVLDDVEDAVVIVDLPNIIDNIANLTAARNSPLRDGDNVDVDNVFNRIDDEELLICKYNIPITVRHFKKLMPTTWLNDEIINFYFGMLQERNNNLRALNPHTKKLLFLNTFFMNKLLGDNLLYDSDRNGLFPKCFNYQAVQKWTKRYIIFNDVDDIYIPINIPNSHWCLIVVDIRNKIIYFYDSIYNFDRGSKFVDATIRWLNEEHFKNFGVPLETDLWNIQILIDIPQQNNGNDCGVYLILFADFRSDGIDVNLINNIAFQRRRIARNILAGDLFYPLY